ncbi:HutD family protein [Brevibacterium atlanticum]|uniref:HutD family protein n=1 Tax=Brevibacterium atlanticum TaxID=2697563 RepID=UPI00141F9B9A|nr:HutD family protein [Brevibacterium atlanticum]
MRVLTSFDDHEPVPWANGAGETTELVSLADSEQLTPHLRPWRLSIARLDHTGPFSALPGMARTFLPTAEVVLTLDGRAHRIPRFTPLSFDGGANVELRELSEPCFAVNLMVAEADSVAPPRRSLLMTGPDENRTAGTGAVPAVAENRPVLVLTLDASPEHQRFELLELSGSAAAAGHLGGVLLY